MDNCDPVFLNDKPVLLKARQKPLITTGITTGWLFLMICAVPFLPGAKGLVVPCGKVITQLPANALSILYVSDSSRPRLISFPPSRQVRFTVKAPASLKKRLSQFPFIVSSAATKY